MTIAWTFRRQVLRAAVKIHAHLSGPARQAAAWTLPQAAWENLRHTATVLRQAEHRAWQVAYQSFLPEVEYAVTRCQRELAALREQLAAHRQPEKVASAGQIVGELLALVDEFETVEIDLQQQTVSVVTADIVLQDCALGPFRIVLDWQQLGQSPAYRCEAQEPRSPPAREDVTHPHVQHGQLCEGAGAAAINRALATGRLYDFFLLIRQILQTYNPHSAHVSLDDWQGTHSCGSCGASLPTDDGSTCQRCHEACCSDCVWTCHGCSDSLCSDCSRACGACGERFCDSCLTTTPGTRQSVCADCQNTPHPDPDQETIHADPHPA